MQRIPYFAFASNAPHGGLTPPALVSRCGRLPAKSDFCDAHTHIRSGAAGVSPPWFVIPTLHRKIEHRSATDGRTFTGAAGVSPPWLGNTNYVRNVPETQL
jgi:hypothetical protein